MAARASEPETARGEVKRRRQPELRREAILEAARAVFLERGYAGASIDAVVERSGGSKATVYALFGNKEGLFGALIADCAEQVSAAIRMLAPDGPVRESLRSLGRRYLEVILLPERLAILRLVAGESGRLPELGDVFYRLGPQTGLSMLAGLFGGWISRGLIGRSDPEQLASHFLGALRGDLFFRSLFNPTRVPTRKEIADHVDAVVDVLLRGCGPAPDA
jgi:TetR/AcrR family transcriptional regulator, mexJK operon transcriptional repressor